MTTLREAAQQALKEMDDHMYRADTHEFYEAKEALRAALAEPEQAETVMAEYKFQTYAAYKTDGEMKIGVVPEPQTTHWEGCEAVHPECRATPRRPLTDEEIKALPEWFPSHETSAVLPLIRAIERAHGIGGEE